MNSFDKLAFYLGVPIVIEPEWSECKKLIDEGYKLWYEGEKLLDEGLCFGYEGEKLREEWRKLWDEGTELWNKGEKLYRDLVDRYFGLGNVHINWKTGEVTKR